MVDTHELLDRIDAIVGDALKKVHWADTVEEERDFLEASLKLIQEALWGDHDRSARQ